MGRDVRLGTCSESETYEARHFGECTTFKSELVDLAKWYLHAESPANLHIDILHPITTRN
jgi:hypothetical protein